MRKTVLAATSALALAASGIASSSPASAHPALLAPAIIAAGIGGLGIAAAAGAANAGTTGVIVPAPAGVQGYYGAYGPGVVVQRGCHPAYERIGGVWQRIEVCR